MEWQSLPEEVKDTGEVGNYYRTLKPLFDRISGGGGFYNLGWLPRNSADSFQDGQKKLVDKVVEPLSYAPEGTLLDVGSGQGAPAGRVNQASGRYVIGLELLLSQLKESNQRKHTGVAFVRGDSQSLPLKSGSISGIYSIESAFHYPDKAVFVAECARVLREGGILSLADIVAQDRPGSQFILTHFRAALAAPNLFTLEEYLRAAVTAGFDVMRIEDLTPGIARSFHKTLPVVQEMRRSMQKPEAKSMRLSQLSLACRLSPFLHPLLPVRYFWFVLKKSNPALL
jgi:27-O-demethylrifamycin SV methyltransferase